ncbi:MAG: serine protease [Nanoarchaeota archaeon]|nr:serine protease [Nanoarchaeota archaeon]
MRLLGLAGIIAALGCGQLLPQYSRCEPLFCVQTQKYDDNNSNVSQELVDSIYAGTYELKVKANFNVEENGNSYPASLSEGGTGHMLNDGYMLTARHVVQLSMTGITNARPRARVSIVSTEITAKKGEEEFIVEIEYISPGRDFAVLRTPASRAPGVYLPVGYSYEMEQGDFVYLFSGRNEPFIKEGTFKESDDDETFQIMADAEQGDSGSMVVAFRAGCPEIVGILTNGHAGHDAKILRIEQIIKEYEGIE